MRHALLRVCIALALVAGALGAAPAQAATDYTYVTMSDGIKIAVSISYPEGFDADREGGWPTIFQYDGYGGGGVALNPGNYGHNYVTLKASIRGTGCSGDRFDLFDRRHVLDGYDIIENFIARQPWSNGKVGITGHSYYGLTGFLVAAMNPPSLEATAVSGLIDDLYRGIVYPGGVPNYGFPAFWTGAYRPFSETSQNAGRYQRETTGGDPTCAANIASRPPREPLDDPILQGLSRDDDTWFAVRALVNYVDGIREPIHITQQYQDEQTGPRGGHVLWEKVSEDVPKRFVATNGVHSTTAVASADRVAWLDCWILQDGNDCGDVADPAKRVNVHFETKGNSASQRNAPLVSSDWPLPETQWSRYYLGSDGVLSTDPTAAEGDTSYVSAVAGRQMTADAGLGLGDESIAKATFTPGPDEASWELDFGTDTAIAGPISMKLWATITAHDTDFFVDVLDVDTATGATTYLQRGMLRASHRAIDHLRSDRVSSGPEAGEIYRPHRPHTNPQPVLPGEATEYLVEVFPVGHVFRTGHKMVVKVHAPPPLDPLSIYAWVSAQPPSLNTIHNVDGMRSSIMLPVLPTLPPIWAEAPACGELVGNPCSTPVL